MKLILNPDYNLYEKNGTAYCDSLQIAETFERRHTHVIDTIEKLTHLVSIKMRVERKIKGIFLRKMGL